MQKKSQPVSRWFIYFTSLFLVLITLGACKKFPHFSHFINDFHQVNLVASNATYGASAVDPSLINGWGIAFAPSGPAWVSSNGAGLSNIYNALGATLRPGVTIPASTSANSGSPTGQVFNATSGFKLSNGNPARFIFVSEDGVISGWNTGNTAEVAKLNMNAVYKGVTIADVNGTPYLYAANFIGRKVEVYDTLWNIVKMPFWDSHIPQDYAPFNVQNINGKVYVVYAKLGEGHDEAHGAGTGIVDIFNPDGSLEERFISHGALNAPWGITAAPASFTKTANGGENIILVGNFGDGRINAYDERGSLLGPLNSEGKPIEIQGLWALSFAPASATSVNPDWLFFTAGPNDEADGLFGYITPEVLENK